MSRVFAALLIACFSASPGVLAAQAPPPAQPPPAAQPPPVKQVTPAEQAPPVEQPPPVEQQSPAEELVAIGDVHGDLKTFRQLLSSVGLIDANGNWSGGARRLVQTGDLLDRGPDSREVLDLMMRLHREAEAAGGRVVTLMGNHEAMNVMGDLRYVTPEEFAAFQKDEPPDERARRHRKLLDLVEKGSPRLRSTFYRALRPALTGRAFDTFFPPGYFGHRDAYAPSGKYGSWLLERPVVHRDGKSLFIHGGLGPRFRQLSMEEINRRVKADLALYLEGVAELEKLGVFNSDLGFGELLWFMKSEKRAGGPHRDAAGAFRKLDAALEGLLFDEEGPLWSRDLALGDETQLSGLVESILERNQVERIVLGHTWSRDFAVKQRFGKRVILIDTGMCQMCYGGRPAALLIGPDGQLRVQQ